MKVFKIVTSMIAGSISSLRKVATALFVLVAFCAVANSQKRLSPLGTPLIFRPDGFETDSPSGYAYPSHVGQPAFELGNSNPSAMFDLKEISFGFLNKFETRVPSVGPAPIDHYRASSFIPQTAGIVIPVKNTRFGLGFDQKYNFGTDYGEITSSVVDTTEDDGYADIGVSRLYSETTLFNYVVSFSYYLGESSTTHEALSLGVRFNYYELDYELSNDDVQVLRADFRPFEYRQKITASGVAIGLAYRIAALRLGASYDRGANFEKGFLRDSWLNKVSFGFQRGELNSSNLRGSFSYAFRDEEREQYASVAHQLVLSTSATVRATKHLSSSFGLLFTRYDIEILDDMSALSLAAAVVYSCANFDLHLFVSDSRLASSEGLEQTSAGIGLTTSLD